MGSLLESLYAYLFQLRQETQFMQTFVVARAVLDAPLQTVEGANVGQDLKKLVEEYTRLIFPHTEADKRKEFEEMRRVLEAYTKAYSSIEVKPLPTLMESVKRADRRAQAIHRGRTASQQEGLSLTRRLQEKVGSR